MLIPRKKRKRNRLSFLHVTDEQQQSQYIKMFKEQSQDAVILTHNIDTPFITYMEQHNENIKFQRIDADVHDSLKDEVTEEEKESFQKTTESLVEIFRKELENENLDDHYLCTDIDRMEKIALQMPLSAINRPSWDRKIVKRKMVLHLWR